MPDSSAARSSSSPPPTSPREAIAWAPPSGIAPISPVDAACAAPVSAWYGPAVDWAKAAGVVAGFPGNEFRPTASATRGQAASWFLATATAINAADS